MVEVVDLKQKFELFTAHWQPKIVAELNDNYVKLVKFKGDFVWHRHEQEDELFLVVRGAFTIKLRDGEISVAEGQFVVIPKGVEHMPVAESEVEVVLLEPKTTLNTGDVENERTVKPEWI